MSRPWLCVLIILLGVVPIGAAQDPAGDRAGTVQRQGSVEVSVRQFGVGGVVRPGDLAGVELNLKQMVAGSPLRVAVQIHERDPDGDTVLVRREVSLGQGADRAVWLYVPIDWGLRSSDPLTVTVRALPDEATGDEVAIGQQVEATSIFPQIVARATESLIGVVGPDSFGIEQYELMAVLRSQPERVRTGHGEYRVVTGITPTDLPDRWMGLAPYEIIIWSESSLGGLTEARASAIEEWVQRGGHLLVVPDLVNSEWFSSGNPLGRILPVGEFQRREDIDLDQFHNLFIRPQVDVTLPNRTVGYIFTPEVDVDRAEAGSIIAGREGTVVATRNLGAGLVTVVGLDLRHRALGAGADIRADQFWHRIFSQRFLIPSPTETVSTSGQNPMRTLLQTHATSGQELAVDTFIAGEIDRSTAVGVGLLLAIIVFGVYWIVAGPGGFAVLKAKNKSHYSWVAFVCAAGLFAVIGWIGARALSPVRVSGEHITFIDSVYGESVQRSRTWVSILLPDYSQQEVSVGTQDDTAYNAIMPWKSPDQSGSISFPDARAYVLGSADPWRLEVPTRSTVKQFRADWLGPSVWEMPFPPTPDARPVATRAGLRGSLVHNLPGPLTDVTIVLNLGMVNEEAMVTSYSKLDGRGQDPRTLTYAWRKNPAGQGGADWAPGEVLDLSAYRIAGDEFLQKRLESQMPGSSFTSIPTIDNVQDGVSLVSWLGHIPGSALAGLGRTNMNVAMHRTTHGLDLTKHLLRPCIIVTGEVKDECPTPLRVDGREFETKGRTIVRWVFPLEDDPLHLQGLRAESRTTRPRRGSN
ncbi:MAG: hypothetical protein ACF8MJ_12550 [Phycisphaerales bacterium JB050]